MPITINVVSLNPTEVHWGVLDRILWDNVCQWLATGQWLSPVSSTNKTDTIYLKNIVESGIKHHNLNPKHFLTKPRSHGHKTFKYKYCTPINGPIRTKYLLATDCRFFQYEYKLTVISFITVRSSMNKNKLSKWTLGVSEWVIVVKCQLSNFSAISWREQVNLQWTDDEVRFVLD